ncbi:cation:proton antiporter [Noviherbaspirillum sp. ST9]|uniref:cation:proton antiporter n=1 Tax=Noviherbaspirillum sp. ST9 TaxID=3401606 RepID=UPI003B58ACC2
MPDFLTGIADLVWPFSIAVAWVLGELAHRVAGLPRITIYALTGFLLSHTQAGLLPMPGESAAMLFANIAFGLILFEFGYRINLRWLRTNPWIAASGIVEAGATFAAVFAVAELAGMAPLPGMLLASLAMASSPAEILRVVNEQRSAGQVTERALHLSALNCVLAVFVFNIIVGLWTFQHSGSLLGAVSNSIVLLLVSGSMGVLFGVTVPGLLRKMGTLGGDATVAFAVAVILLCALAQALKMSPVLAALTFGFVTRHRRVTLGQAQRNFGALGDMLTVLLFVFIGATLAWPRIAAGIGTAAAIVGVRLVAKLVGVTLFARASGTSWRKGLLSALSLSPMSVLVLAMLVRTHAMGIDLLDHLAPLAAATLFLAIAGPLLTQWALKLAGETPEKEA